MVSPQLMEQLINCTWNIKTEETLFTPFYDETVEVNQRTSAVILDLNCSRNLYSIPSTFVRTIVNVNVTQNTILDYLIFYSFFKVKRAFMQENMYSFSYM